MDPLTLINADCLTALRALPAESVQTCVTSPPYFGLRDYGHSDQIGLEETPAAFVAKLVEVFEEVRRVLRSDGTLWLNLGDSYANDSKWGGSSGGKHVKALHGNTGIGRGKKSTGLKSKDLIGIPWRVAFALQAAGWYLRQDIIWAKPNPMPESITDRCTKAHEYIFLLSKSARYHYDADAIKEIAVTDNLPGNETHNYTDACEAGDERHRTKAGLVEYSRKRRESKKRGEFNGKTNVLPGREAFRAVTEVRNKRSVWTVASQPYKGAHFACFPPDLIKPCVLAAAPPGSVVLDPFGGSGTTGMVALELGRRALLIELNPEYCALIRQRCAITPGLALSA
jgi:DNA modification methylase